MERRYMSGAFTESKVPRFETTSRFSSAHPRLKTTRSSSIYGSPSHLRTPSFTRYSPQRELRLDNDLIINNLTASGSENYTPWSSNQKNRFNFDHESFLDHYRTSRRLLDERKKREKSSHVYRHQSSFPLSPSLLPLSSYQPTTFTTPPSQPLSILNRYLSSQMQVDIELASSFRPTYDSSLFLPEHSIKPSSVRESYPLTAETLQEGSLHLPVSTSRRSRLPLARSQSLFQTARSSFLSPLHAFSALSPSSTSGNKERRSQVVGRVLHERNGYQRDRRPPLHYDYHAGRIAYHFETPRPQKTPHFSMTQPYQFQPLQKKSSVNLQHHRTSFPPTSFGCKKQMPPQCDERGDQATDTSVVATSNIVSSRTSVQRDLPSRPPSLARSLARSSVIVPERSRSVAVTGAEILHRRPLSILHRPRSVMITDHGASRARLSSAGLRTSAVSPSRSSIVGSCVDMFKIEMPKRKSLFEQSGFNERRPDSMADVRRMHTGPFPETLSLAEARSSRGETGKSQRYESYTGSRLKEEGGGRRSSFKCSLDRAGAPKVRSYTSSVYGVHVPESLTPTISETRKKAREVLCKVRKDPAYYFFN